MKKLILIFQILILAFALPASARKVSSDGAEIQINTNSVSRGTWPTIASAADGRFVVSWANIILDGSVTGISAQLFDSNGNSVGSEFLVNTYTLNKQDLPSVAMAPNGDFVIAWSSLAQDGSGTGVFAQRFDATGSTIGAEFQVNTYTLNNQSDPSVAMAQDGSFVIVWHSDSQDGSYLGVYGQRYDSNGSPVGPEFQVNTFTSGLQFGQTVKIAQDGSFIVAWYGVSNIGPNINDVYAQRYDSNGSPLGSNFMVNTTVIYSQDSPSIAIGNNGTFLVAWKSRIMPAFSGVFAQLFDATGSPIGSEFQVNTNKNQSASLPSISAAPDGSFVISWMSNDSSFEGIAARIFDESAKGLTREFLVNSFEYLEQRYPATTTFPDNSFAIVWFSNHQMSIGGDVFLRKGCLKVPHNRCIDYPDSFANHPR